MNINSIKAAVVAAAGVIGGGIAAALGGWDKSVIAMLVLMGLDLLLGIIGALVFKSSTKTQTGALSSWALGKGVAKKVVELILVCAAHYADGVIGVEIIRDAVVIAFCAAELISIIENAGNMGVPVPAPIRKAIDILQKKEDVDVKDVK